MDFKQNTHTYLDSDKFQTKRYWIIILSTYKIRLMNLQCLASKKKSEISKLMNLADWPASEWNDWQFGVALLSTFTSTWQMMVPRTQYHALPRLTEGIE